MMSVMVETTARLLGVLSALQSGGPWSGPHLATRLGVTVRTVRRDVDRLRQLGYAVESDVGSQGGYRLGAGGAATPPLMLEADEVVALAVCVRAAAGDSVAGVADAAARALAKLEQTLPANARRAVTAVSDSTVRLTATGDAVDPDVLVAVSGACRNRRQVRATYRSRGGRPTERRLEPYRVVNAGRRWYLVAYDLGPHEWRTFRIDRIADVIETGHGVRLLDPPDAATFVGEAITTAPYRWRARVVLDASLEHIAALVPPTVGVLEGIDSTTTRLTTGADDLDMLVVHLGCLGVTFRVVEPDELRHRVAEVAARLADVSASAQITV
jgi:predicted DNA-binding transcriptional regulator YafY